MSLPEPTPPPRTTGGNWQWEPPTAGELQALMPGYTIEKLLGRGGMGAVYKGVQENLDRTVAIKILPPGVEKEDPSFAERFKNEAKVMAKLMHPGIVAVFDFGKTTTGQFYFAMEYADGTDVSQMIKTQGKLSSDHALAITAHVCDALGAAHELGIVHRDIKPANVLINMKGQVKVADFGLAKIEEPGQHGLTRTGYAMGTPDFVAPEVLMLGTHIDGRADLYAVGVMLYQMLTGEVPRGAFKPASVRVPGLDRRYDPIIMKAMQSDREERYQSSAELRRDLDVILTVPLVKQDAPTVAAIPIAQVAQIPAQRSAAQKPVGKSPSAPQQKSADVPARQQSSTPQSGAKLSASQPTKVPAKKSNVGMIYGIAASVAVVAVLIFLFGGGKKPVTKPVVKTQVAPVSPTAGANTVTSKSVVTVLVKPTTAPENRASSLATNPGNWVDRLKARKWEAPWVLKNDVLKTTDKAKAMSGSLAMMQDGAVRVRARSTGSTGTQLQLLVRSGAVAGKQDTTGLYQMQVPFTGRTCTLIYMERRKGIEQPSETLWRSVPLPAALAGQTEIEWELRAVGAEISAWANGKLVASAHDTRVPKGSASFTSDVGLEITKVETIDFTGIMAKESATPAIANSAPPAALEPAAIRLWDTREKIPASPKLRWEKNAARVDGQLLAAKVSLRDLVCRANVFVNYESGSQIHARVRHGTLNASSHYSLGIAPDLKLIVLGVTIAGEGKALKTWPLSRTAGEQWLQLELRLVGDELTASADGKVLGTVHDTTVPEAGDLVFFAKAAGYFRDIEYVPLDQPVAGVATTALRAPSTEPASMKPASLTQQFPPGQWVKVFNDLAEMSQAGVTTLDLKMTQADGWFVPSTNAIDLRITKLIATNLGIRATFKRTPQLFTFDITSSGGSHRFTSALGSGSVTLSLSPERTTLFTGKGAIDSQQDDFPMEFACVAGRYIGRFNGLLAFVVPHQKRSNARPSLYNAGEFRDIEVINLDGLSEAEALKLLGVDEKGNDLRAAALAQAKQAMEQKQQAQTMATIPELAELDEQFKKLTAERVTAPFEADVAKLNSSYLGGLDRKIDEEKAAGHLDGVIVLEAEKKLLADKQPIPAEDAEGTTPNLKQLRSIYHSSHAKIDTQRSANLKALTDPLSVRLKALEADLTKKDRVPDAKTVREYREGLAEPGAARAGASENAGAPPPASTISATTTGKPSKAKVNHELSRKAAEYVLIKGGKVSVEQNGTKLDVQPGDTLPKGTWDLWAVQFPTGSMLTDEDVQAVTEVVELKEFRSGDQARSTVSSLLPFKNTPQLAVLAISGLGEVSREECEMLAGLEALQDLRLSGTKPIADLGMALGRSKMNRLQLEGRPLSAADFAAINRQSDLQWLNLGISTTDEIIAQLTGLTGLFQLHAPHATITGSALQSLNPKLAKTLKVLAVGSATQDSSGTVSAAIERFPLLEELHIRGEVSAEALARLHTLDRFTKLTHMQAAVTPQHINAISQCKTITELKLGRGQITSADVTALKRIRNLRVLTLQDNGITLDESALSDLAQLKTLTQLDLPQSQVTSAAAENLRKLLPGCKITLVPVYN